MGFGDANDNPAALHQWTIELLHELAGLTGLEIRNDQVLAQKDLVVPEAQHPVALLAQEQVSLHVGCVRVCQGIGG